jgi:hypothetical protein
LKQSKEIIVKQANALIMTIENVLKEAYSSLNYKISCMLILFRAESYTQEQAGEIERITKNKIIFDGELMIRLNQQSFVA